MPTTQTRLYRHDGGRKKTALDLAGNGDDRPQTKARKSLKFHFISVAVAAGSGYIATRNPEVKKLDQTDMASLALLVVLGTYVACRAGKSLGRSLAGYMGLMLGGITGALVGVAVGATGGAIIADRNEKAEGVVIGGAGGGLGGGAIGATFGALVLSYAGAIAGFWGGAYLGHEYSKDASLHYIFKQPAAVKAEISGHTAQSITAEKAPVLHP
jgi:hypothetical protein